MRTSVCTARSSPTNPHPENGPPPDAAWTAAILLWTQARQENQAGCESRYTEVHPPDWIKILDPPRPIDQTFRGVTVVAPGTFPTKPAIESTLDVTILAPPRPSPGAIMRYVELVGPETYGSIEGDATNSGAAITQVDGPPGIRVQVKVTGSRTIFGGETAKFRALYWIYWEPQPTPTRTYAPAVALLLGDDAPATLLHKHPPKPGELHLPPKKLAPRPAKSG